MRRCRSAALVCSRSIPLCTVSDGFIWLDLIIDAGVAAPSAPITAEDAETPSNDVRDAEQSCLLSLF